MFYIAKLSFCRACICLSCHMLSLIWEGSLILILQKSWQKKIDLLLFFQLMYTSKTRLLTVIKQVNKETVDLRF